MPDEAQHKLFELMNNPHPEATTDPRPPLLTPRKCAEIWARDNHLLGPYAPGRASKSSNSAAKEQSEKAVPPLQLGASLASTSKANQPEAISDEQQQPADVQRLGAEGKLFFCANQNRDDKLTFDEFCKGVALIGVRPLPSPREMRRLFEVYDQNGNNKVDCPEFCSPAKGNTAKSSASLIAPNALWKEPEKPAGEPSWLHQIESSTIRARSSSWSGRPSSAKQRHQSMVLTKIEAAVIKKQADQDQFKDSIQRETQEFEHLEQQAMAQADVKVIPLPGQEILSEPMVAAELDMLWERYARAGKFGTTLAINFIQFVRLAKETGIYPIRIQMEGLRQVFTGMSAPEMHNDRRQEITPGSWHATFWQLCQYAFGESEQDDDPSAVVAFLEQISAEEPAPLNQTHGKPELESSQQNNPGNPVAGLVSSWRALCRQQREQLDTLRTTVVQARTQHGVMEPHLASLQWEASKLFDAADSDSDGLLLLADLKNYIKANKQVKPPGAANGGTWRSFFSALSSDANGAISWEDLVLQYVATGREAGKYSRDVLAVPSVPVNDKALRKVLMQLSMKDKALSKPDIGERSRTARLKERQEIVKLLHRLGPTIEPEPGLCHAKASSGLFVGFVGHCCVLGVVVYDAAGKLCAVADNSMLSAQSSDGCACEIRQTGLGECQVSFTPTSADLEHTIGVAVAGAPICGSPFSVPIITLLPRKIRVVGADCVAVVVWSTRSRLCEGDEEIQMLVQSNLQQLDNGAWDVQDSPAGEMDGGCLVQLQYNGHADTLHWFYCDTAVMKESPGELYTIDATDDHSTSFRWSPLGSSPSIENPLQYHGDEMLFNEGLSVDSDDFE